METHILQYDLLWLQSIPSIANLYYCRYLKETHQIYCPNNDLPTRSLARSIVSAIKQNKPIKTALYFEEPCSDIKRNSIFEFISKQIPDLTCFCLSVPCSPLQTSLLLGWSAALENKEWKERCLSIYKKDAFKQFQPPTSKSGHSECNDFVDLFAISSSIFNKEAIFVYFTTNMISFDDKQVLVLSDSAKNSVQGWIESCKQEFKTLIWIIDERSLFGDKIYNINQNGREALLQTYRKSVQETIQSFNSDMPIYSYVVDYFNENAFDLIACLGELLHRHNLSICKSTLLTWSKEETTRLHQHYSINCIYLQQEPIFNVSKWKSIHNSQSSEKMSTNDKLKYISPDILQLEEELIDLYKIPLLKSQNNDMPLTKAEQITRHIHHAVSAKSLEIFDTWAALGHKSALEPAADSVTIPSSLTDAGVEPFEPIETPINHVRNEKALRKIIQSLTMEKINDFINSPPFFERGSNLKDQVASLAASSDHKDSVKLTAQISIDSSNTLTTSITFAKNNDGYILDKGTCTCPVVRNCKHCAAALLYAFDKQSDVVVDDDDSNSQTQSQSQSQTQSQSQSQNQSQSQSQSQSDSSVLFKRSHDVSEEGNTSSSNESRKKAHSSIESYDSVSTVAYDPAGISPPPESCSTAEEEPTQVTLHSVNSRISTPSLRSHSSEAASSNEKSSYSQNTTSSGNKSSASIPSFGVHSDSLSDNQDLKESLDQIVETEEEEEAEIYIENTRSTQPTYEDADDEDDDEIESNTIVIEVDDDEEELADTQPVDDSQDLADTQAIHDTQLA